MRADNYIELKFERDMSTGDSTDYIFTDGATVDLIWAYGRPATIYHGLNQRGSGQIIMKETYKEDGAFQVSTALTMALIGVLLLLM